MGTNGWIDCFILYPQATSMVPKYPAGNDSAVGDRVPALRREIDDQWIDEHYGRIHRAAWLMTGNVWEAEDLAQETFVVALDRWDEFEGRSSDSTWLYGILIRLAQRRGRSLARMRRRLLQYVERNGLVQASGDGIDDPQAALARKQWRESVWADVARLPNAQRVAVILRYAEEMPYERIAEVVGCATGTAKTRVHHGLRRLRQHFGVESFGDCTTGDEQRPLNVEPRSELNAESNMKPSIHIATRS